MNKQWIAAAAVAGALSVTELIGGCTDVQAAEVNAQAEETPSEELKEETTYIEEAPSQKASKVETKERSGGEEQPLPEESPKETEGPAAKEEAFGEAASTPEEALQEESASEEAVSEEASPAEEEIPEDEAPKDEAETVQSEDEELPPSETEEEESSREEAADETKPAPKHEPKPSGEKEKNPEKREPHEEKPPDERERSEEEKPESMPAAAKPLPGAITQPLSEEMPRIELSEETRQWMDAGERHLTDEPELVFHIVSDAAGMVSSPEIVISRNGEEQPLSAGTDYRIVWHRREDAPGYEATCELPSELFSREGAYEMKLKTPGRRGAVLPADEEPISFTVDKTGPGMVVEGLHEGSLSYGGSKLVTLKVRDNYALDESTLRITADGKPLELKKIAEGVWMFCLEKNTRWQQLGFEAEDLAGNPLDYVVDDRGAVLRRTAENGSLQMNVCCSDRLSVLLERLGAKDMVGGHLPAGILLLTGGSIRLILKKQRKKARAICLYRP